MLFYHDFKAAEAQQRTEEDELDGINALVDAVRTVSRDELDALYAQSEGQAAIIKRMRAALVRLATRKYPPAWVKRIAHEALGPEEIKLLRKRPKSRRVG